MITSVLGDLQSIYLMVCFVWSLHCTPWFCTTLLYHFCTSLFASVIAAGGIDWDSCPWGPGSPLTHLNMHWKVQCQRTSSIRLDSSAFDRLQTGTLAVIVLVGARAIMVPHEPWHPCLAENLILLSGQSHKRDELSDGQQNSSPLVVSLPAFQFWAQQSASVSSITKPELQGKTRLASVPTSRSAPSTHCCCLQGRGLLSQNNILCTQLLYLICCLWVYSSMANSSGGVFSLASARIIRTLVGDHCINSSLMINPSVVSVFSPSNCYIRHSNSMGFCSPSSSAMNNCCSQRRVEAAVGSINFCLRTSYRRSVGGCNSMFLLSVAISGEREPTIWWCTVHGAVTPLAANWALTWHKCLQVGASANVSRGR